MTFCWAFIPSCCAAEISDMQAAREWCDRTMLHRVEGIWEFPEDQTHVLIRRSLTDNNSYEIIVVDSPDTRLHAGDNIGSLTNSPVSAKFEMTLCRTLTRGILANPGKCLAELKESENAMLIKGKRMKFTLASRWFLPSFWRAVRVSVKNPLDELPRGLVRVYPQNGSRREPDYL